MLDAQPAAEPPSPVWAAAYAALTDILQVEYAHAIAQTALDMHLDLADFLPALLPHMQEVHSALQAHFAEALQAVLGGAGGKNDQAAEPGLGPGGVQGADGQGQAAEPGQGQVGDQGAGAVAGPAGDGGADGVQALEPEEGLAVQGLLDMHEQPGVWHSTHSHTRKA